MIHPLSLWVVWVVFFLPAFALDIQVNASFSVSQVCHVLGRTIEPVYWPGSKHYDADIKHFLPSSTQNATCSVEPKSTRDVATVLEVIGVARTPFAVKGVGHTSNVGFSSTTGVQIAMSHFKNISYDAKTQVVTVGAGVTWDEVYAVVNPLGRNVAGARAPGVGVAGFTLGGGVNYLQNEVGLTLDTVVGFTVVLPTGLVKEVTENDHDLWFALRGGLNQFGIVTEFKFKTFPQGQIWTVELDVPGESVDEFNAAVADFFETSTDPKATAIVQYRYFNSSLQLETTLFYNAPTPPKGLFDKMLAIPNASGTPATRNFTDILALGTPAVSGSRFTFDDTEVVQLSRSLLDAIANETVVVGQAVEDTSAQLIMFMIWQNNVQDYLSHGSSSAWPPSRSFETSINGWSLWLDESDDDAILANLQSGGDRLGAYAQSLGQDLSKTSLYPNISPKNTPVEAIYGSNLGRLKQIKKKYDPAGVMCLTGGFKIC
ncbi:FAD-binding domain-containing protein [Amylostereum chailletii]|nr:FAD-binding domain-containing protein [Amylostereum chailletii]